MSENLSITHERVDDIPLLLAQLERMQVAALLDEHFPTHGNWQGMSLGTVASVWLTFLLSEANHRLSHVEPWAAQRLTTLGAGVGQPVRALDFSDDRLATVLDYLSDDAQWEAFEQALNAQTLRVYDLQPQRVRIDSTTAKGYGMVTPEGLLQLGHSKDHRPDLPQVKINLSVLDPLGLPLTTTVVSGERADDPLYLPEIQRVQASLGRRGVTYVGDCKMAALQTRATVAASGDYYLCPLSSTQLPAVELAEVLAPVWQGEQPLRSIYRPADQTRPQRHRIAEGYEYTVELRAQGGDQSVQWTERRLVVRSLKWAATQERAVRQRLATAQREIATLTVRRQGKKRVIQAADLQAAAEQLVATHRVGGLVNVSVATQTTERPLRGYGTRPASVRGEPTLTVTTQVNDAALATTLRSLGWRVYATNQPARQLSLPQAVLAYRAEYLVEQGFGRLKGKPLALTPLYLDSDARVTGLIRLLTMGLRVLTLLEFGARRQLHEEGQKLAGLYAGNPTRATARPTTELMLHAFEGLTLTFLRAGDGGRMHLTPLTPVQQRILELLDLSPTIYWRLAQHCSEPILNLSEP
jgi:transposase